MTTKEILKAIAILMEENFNEYFEDYDAQVRHIVLDNHKYDVFSDDLRLFSELQNKLEELDNIKMNK